MLLHKGSSLVLLQLLIATTSARTLLGKRDVVVSSNLPVNWTYTGCYTDQTYLPTLSGAMYFNTTSMTQESCIMFCATKGFIHSGVEYSYQCFCGNDDLTQAMTATSTDCSYACSGNSSEVCGGSNRLNIFTSNQTTSSPVTNNGTGLWSLYGCYIEGINGRALTTDMDTSPGGGNNMTVANCVYSCQAAGYVLAGLEYAGQCFCGNQFSYNTMPAADGYKGCNMPCNGNATELCGGADYLDIYGYNNTVPNLVTMASSTVTSTTTLTSGSSTTSSTSTNAVSTPSWYAIGCYTDVVGSRSLNYQQYGNANIMTQELCISECATAGYTISGTEYYSECYCDNQFRNGGALASDPATCNTPCQGNANETCGGGDRLTVFQYGIKGASSSLSSLSTTSTAQTNVAATSSSQYLSSGSTTTNAAVQSVPVWAYSGCYNDSVGARTLMNAIYGDGNVMTNELCQSSCKSAGYTIAGTEYSGECYCDTTLRNYGAPASDGSVGCNMACNGNSSEICGGANRLSLYTFTSGSSSSSSSSPTTALNTVSSSSPSNTQAVPNLGWVSIGCYNDSVGSRTLGNAIYGNGNIMTVELCESSCRSAGYNISGVEYGGECYCDTAFRNYGAPASDGNTGCNMACNGNANEICGGGNRLNVYKYVVAASSSSSSLVSSTSNSIISSSSQSSSSSQLTSSGTSTSQTISSSLFTSSTSTITPVNQATASSSTSTASSSAASSTMAVGWYALGCYTDSVEARTLGNAIQVQGGDNNMTIENCEVACLAAKYTLAGVEYAGQCYCDNALQNGGGPAPDGNTYCDMACNGNASEACGGPNRLNMYSYYGGPSPTGDSASAAASSTSVAMSTKASSAATALPSGWQYDGCYIDGAYGRIMENEQNDNQQLTIESCVSTCTGLGYIVAGIEYGVQCFCDNYVRNSGALTSDSDCNMNCPGNSAEKCGAGSRMSIYSYGNLTVYQVPTPKNTSLPGSWEYQGCLTDNADARTFPYRITNMIDNNTATNCLSLCSTFGYPAGGMEYSSECYCGDFSNIVNAGATFVPDSECNMACSGDPSSTCGSGGLMSYYAWTGAPLYEWSRPIGNDAGAYEFLIGGVVIPLVTSQTIKGKVTFLEKFGTGAPNTTGAYELDIAELNNFTGAWRPMHVKTDIFCSASLTLPDKAGRQINVGGWANDATYGIRLYTPDGEPGVWGVNDWQENVDEVSLQNGRWYPSAMIMPNGTILVVGGEEGSNGAPVPTLEMLPPSGPVLYCDWLDRTDPYNLYPFLAVLPSGGVFVAYYNEARILDETTLETSKVLPNIPAAVNDFLGGRTYPFEGTSVLMPQYAPYGDPLTVMICGGSTPGPEIALDNCVSLQPEVAGANWTIERMPSSRVISCMTALPDGTYLILNGGQQGRAGFGLATNPNLNAVLYDPSKPINQRMSVMANTTVDRLYHSEAILLQDGRVLVSGSDPEDTRFPQEYRVEVFVPPYLLSGLPAPTFNITETDWSYGSSYTFTITSGTVSKVSLLGAESSTHGNSMGQRTIFPAWSCSGNTCTVTAPPNSNVCPPGWFQLFVLDGPTPSVSTYVRIGGDPAGIGNWPDFEDFMPLPGV